MQCHKGSCPIVSFNTQADNTTHAVLLRTVCTTSKYIIFCGNGYKKTYQTTRSHKYSRKHFNEQDLKPLALTQKINVIDDYLEKK